jgi:hypothetical protein
MRGMRGMRGVHAGGRAEGQFLPPLFAAAS